LPGSFYSKLPFSTKKSGFVWSVSVIVVLTIVNSHILFLNGYIDEISVANSTLMANETDIHCYTYANGFPLFPVWDQVNMVLYNFLPAIIMFIFNILIIVKALSNSEINMNKHNKKAMKRMQKKRRMSISLVVITFAFLIMNLPATIYYGYFKQNELVSFNLGGILDFFSFLNHSSVFFTSFLTNVKFRQSVYNVLKCFQTKKSKNFRAENIFTNIERA